LSYTRTTINHLRKTHYNNNITRDYCQHFFANIFYFFVIFV